MDAGRVSLHRRRAGQFQKNNSSCYASLFGLLLGYFLSIKTVAPALILDALVTESGAPPGGIFLPEIFSGDWRLVLLLAVARVGTLVMGFRNTRTQP